MITRTNSWACRFECFADSISRKKREDDRIFFSGADRARRFFLGYKQILRPETDKKRWASIRGLPGLSLFCVDRPIVLSLVVVKRCDFYRASGKKPVRARTGRNGRRVKVPPRYSSPLLMHSTPALVIRIDNGRLLRTGSRTLANDTRGDEGLLEASSISTRFLRTNTTSLSSSASNRCRLSRPGA